MDGLPRLEEIADTLYLLPPGEFVPARDELVRRARAAGDRPLAKEVQGLRKPASAAWVVNLLVRRAGDQVTALLDLGESLRTAQAALDGDQLKELSRQRAQVVAAIAREGRRLAREAGHPVSAGVEEEVAETLRAALADPAAAAAVRSGRLTGTLSYAGLGELDVTGVVALAPRRAVRDATTGGERTGGERTDGGRTGRPTDDAAVRRPGRPRPVRTPDDAEAAADRERRALEAERAREEERRRAELERARTDLVEAEDAVDAARGAERVAADGLDEAREDAEQAQARVSELEEALRRAQQAATEATAAVRPRRREHESARHALDVAVRALERARTRLHRLEG